MKLEHEDKVILAWVFVIICLLGVVLMVSVVYGNAEKLRAQPVVDSEKAIFMQGCITDGNKEYQCILMWREHDEQ